MALKPDTGKSLAHDRAEVRNGTASADDKREVAMASGTDHRNPVGQHRMDHRTKANHRPTY